MFIPEGGNFINGECYAVVFDADTENFNVVPATNEEVEHWSEQYGLELIRGRAKDVEEEP
jgi:hypothetical protein